MYFAYGQTGTREMVCDLLHVFLVGAETLRELLGTEVLAKQGITGILHAAEEFVEPGLIARLFRFLGLG